MSEVKWMSAGEAAAILGVTPRRVHQLLDSGELAAEQIGGRALLNANDVYRRSQHRPPSGRPLSPDLAWAVVAALSEHNAGPVLWLRSAAPDRRLRHRLMRLLSNSHSTEEWRQLLRRRAEGRRYFAHSSILEDLLADQLVSIGGARAAAAHGLDISSGDDGLAYIARSHVPELVSAFALEPDPSGNLELLIYDDSASSGGPTPGKPVPVAAAVFDMLDSDDVRMQHQARRWLDEAFSVIASKLGTVHD